MLVPFAYLSSSYSKFEWAENAAVQARTKKLSGKQICCTTKWFLRKLDNLSHLYPPDEISSKCTFAMVRRGVEYPG